MILKQGVLQENAEGSKNVIKKYLETGLHIEYELVDPAFCDALIASANDFAPVKAGDYRTALQPHRISSVFMEALRHPGITGILSEMLGGKISCIQTQFFYGKPGTPGFQPHQDNRYVNAPQGQFASAWVALTDVSKENGGLYIYPGTQVEPLLGVEEVPFEESHLQDSNAMRLRCLIPEKYKPMDVEVSKGSVVFFDGHTVHGSHDNVSNRHRYALLMTYILQGSSFVPGRYAQRHEIPID